ncbi:Hypothetical protein NGAL_HAMBI1145_29310 [Neorhizobium galegae bv. officinalis]|uniref:Uncharacterized protein n=1 Tax=Neorhizobium galegae bv. officinalis TaxID=323656 RepID=A0A0T7FKR7_NEOGA|nr:hypothetical protein [Neorhizobium galegae]CDZ35610.1 Hypothetical protein NGAL_HAMBI1145_29310 [Neorhizobium galegae bv. officinalis]
MAILLWSWRSTARRRPAGSGRICDPVRLEPEDRRRVDDHRAGESGTWLRFATQIRAGSASALNEPAARLWL